ncbi:hypothetical protein USB125703_00924 [Pseudoclavibacter triregionum]|nr:hypothetical protein USB125703_00924 [Pseudoclavibacter triregionum]
MISDTFTSASPRTRATALALAFGVVAGGVALAASPSFANPDAPVATTAAASSVSVSAVSAEVLPSGALAVTGTGFTPGAMVYVQVTDPSGVPNFAYGSEALTADASGAVSASLPAPAAGWTLGAYEMGLYESDALKAATTIKVVETVATPTPTPTETAPATTAPAETTPAATTPVETTPVETTPAATTPVETTPVESTPAETTPAATAPVETPAALEAWAKPEVATLTAAQAQAQGVGYSLGGFAPGRELELILTLPDGSAAHFDSFDPIVPDANGEYVGRITNSGTWLTGQYTVQVQTKSTTVAAIALAAAPELQHASFTFTVTDESGAVNPADQAGTGTGSHGTSGQDSSTTQQGGTQLADTGADLYGPAGIALATLAAGAGAVLVSRRFRGRSAE